MKMRPREEIQKLDQTIAKLRADGNGGTEIAKIIGEPVMFVYGRIAIMKNKGVIGEVTAQKVRSIYQKQTAPRRIPLPEITPQPEAGKVWAFYGTPQEIETVMKAIR